MHDRCSIDDEFPFQNRIVVRHSNKWANVCARLLPHTNHILSRKSLPFSMLFSVHLLDWEIIFKFTNINFNDRTFTSVEIFIDFSERFVFFLVRSNFVVPISSHLCSWMRNLLTIRFWTFFLCCLLDIFHCDFNAFNVL